MPNEPDITLRVGDKVTVKGSTLTVTELDAVTIPPLRARLVEVASRGDTTTYGALKSDLELPHAVNGLGRLLDLIEADCAGRGEPSLAALVVSQGTGEVGVGANQDAESQRQMVYRRWSPPSAGIESFTTEFTLNGQRRQLSSQAVRARVLPTPPDPVRTHWVEIDGRRWPPKQAFRTALDLRDEPFISHFAIRVFRRLGFTTSPLPDETAPTRPNRSLASLSQLAPTAAEPANTGSALTDEDALLAFRRLDAFLAAESLTSVLSGLEDRLLDADDLVARDVAVASGFDEDLVDSALVIRERVGMLDTLIHAAVITQVLPLILRPGERVLRRPSLGAGNDPERVYDLETTHRVAEFKLSSWKGADGARQRSLFADVVGLSLDDTDRRREVYVVGELPRRFLTGSNRNAVKTLSKASLRVRQPMGISATTTVSEFTAAARIHVVDLCDLLPRLR